MLNAENPVLIEGVLSEKFQERDTPADFDEANFYRLDISVKIIGDFYQMEITCQNGLYLNNNTIVATAELVMAFTVFHKEELFSPSSVERTAKIISPLVDAIVSWNRSVIYNKSLTYLGKRYLNVLPYVSPKTTYDKVYEMLSIDPTARQN